jgi:alpha-beta hydrolase superfamily lysophospholipase
VVLAHGYTATLAEWNVVWDALVARGYRVIAFDQRGHARSTVGAVGIGSEPMAADYAPVLEHFDARVGVLVGQGAGMRRWSVTGLHGSHCPSAESANELNVTPRRRNEPQRR